MLTRVMILFLCILVAGCAYAGQASMNSMVVGQKALELTYTWQATFNDDGDAGSACISPDGNWVAFQTLPGKSPTDSSHVNIGVVDLSEGRTRALLMTSPNQDDKDSNGVWFSPEPFAWSPNSKMLAFVAMRGTPSTGGAIRDMTECWLLVSSPTGIRKAAFQMDKDNSISNLKWSPDGRRLAAMAFSFNSETRELHTGISIFDLTANKMDLVELPKHAVFIDWSPDGEAFQYTLRENQAEQLWEISLDGKSSKVIRKEYDDKNVSPDGRLSLDPDYPTITVRGLQTGAVTKVLKAPSSSIIGWLPNSKMFTFRRQDSITDVDGRRRRYFNSIWLGNVDARPVNHMCVALDASLNETPTWSSDGLRMAYVCDSRVFVAQLAWREPNMREKVALKIPLSPEEQNELKNEVLSQGKQIGLGALMYAADHGENLPGMDSIMQDILPYIKNDDMFYLPGTTDNLFKYLLQGNSKDISDPANTVIGEMDAGYGWIVQIYADGHCKVKE